MILAGGQGSRLLILSQKRAKPAVPFGGIYRLIDFTITNVMRSGIRLMGILTQYRPYSLMDHISNGEAWGFVGRRRSARILPPYVGEDESDWYLGTADAIYQNLSFIERFKADTVVILSGDHVYCMDYSDIIRFHAEKNADLTIAMKHVPFYESSRFGIADVNADSRVVDFFEKPANPPTNIASLGIYVFKAEVLKQRLLEDTVRDSSHDFAKDLIPRMVKKDKVFCYLFEDYWQDVGTISTYWSANMDALNCASGLDLFKWGMRTNPFDRKLADKFPARFTSTAKVGNSIISPGCVISGEVFNSVLSPGVIVKKGAMVKNSIVFHDTVIGVNVEIDKTIVDKDVVIGDNCVIGVEGEEANYENPDLLNSGITLIGKYAKIPSGEIVEKNSLVYPEVDAHDLPDSLIESGYTIYHKGE